MYGMVWYGMVWYGMVWYGMVWYGMVWYGMESYGMVWYGMVWSLLSAAASSLWPFTSFARVFDDQPLPLHPLHCVLGMVWWEGWCRRAALLPQLAANSLTQL